jgi:hypothetical protein
LNSLILVGCAVVGFIFGVGSVYLFRCRRRAFTTVFRRATHRAHSMRGRKRELFRLRPRYSHSLRHFRFNPRDNQGW